MKLNVEQAAKLVTLAQSGDSDAFNQLLAGSEHNVYYPCLKMLGDKEKALDATQDVFIKVFQKLDTVKDPNTYFAWLKQVTTNHCKTLSSRSKDYLLVQQQEGEKDILADFAETDEQLVPDKAIDNAETQRIVMDIIDELPTAQKECIYAFYYNEMKIREIAEALDVSENTVKSRLSYGKKAIKEGVEDCERKGGIKLHSFSALPFIAYFMQKDAMANMLTEAQQALLVEGVAGGLAGTVVAGATGAGAGAGAVSASGVAASAGATVAKGVSAKLIAGILVAALAVGGIAVAVVVNRPDAEPVVAPSSQVEVVSEPEVVEETPIPTPEPTPVVLDEPAEGIDRELAYRLIEMINEVRAEEGLPPFEISNAMMQKAEDAIVDEGARMGLGLPSFVSKDWNKHAVMFGSLMTESNEGLLNDLLAGQTSGITLRATGFTEIGVGLFPDFYSSGSLSGISYCLYFN